MEFTVCRQRASNRDHLVVSFAFRPDDYLRTQTIAPKRMLGSWILNANEINRMATGLNACYQLTSFSRRRIAYLEHLDEADTETEVGVVGQDQRAREEGSDGKDGSDPSISLSCQHSPGPCGWVDPTLSSISLAPSTKVVVRCSTRVAIAYSYKLGSCVRVRGHTEKNKCHVVRKTGKGNSRLEKTYSDNQPLLVFAPG
jgi:hypothetical protein